MGYNRRNDEIRDNVERMRREREAYADALATVDNLTHDLRPRSQRGSGRRLPPHLLQNTIGWSSRATVAAR
jgi:hypothetical protein